VPGMEEGCYARDPAKSLFRRQTWHGQRAGREMAIEEMVLVRRLAKAAQVVQANRLVSANAHLPEENQAKPGAEQEKFHQAEDHTGDGQSATPQPSFGRIDLPQAVKAEEQGRNADQEQQQVEEQAEDSAAADARSEGVKHGFLERIGGLRRSRSRGCLFARPRCFGRRGGVVRWPFFSSMCLTGGTVAGG